MFLSHRQFSHKTLTSLHETGHALSTFVRRWSGLGQELPSSSPGTDYSSAAMGVRSCPVSHPAAGLLPEHAFEHLGDAVVASLGCEVVGGGNRVWMTA